MNPGIPELLGIIRDEITAHGPMTYARFMELALYHPAWGYYTRVPETTGGPWTDPRELIGWSGDFYTSADVHHALGWALAKQIEEVDARLGRPARFTVVEVGPGKGFLARDILRTCETDFPALFDRLHYVLVDRSPVHQAAQRTTLDRWLHARGQVSWRDAIHSFETDSLVGVVLSNELIDALPVHRVAMVDGTLRECYVSVEGDRLCERIGPLSAHTLADYFADLDLTLPEGARAEVNVQAQTWIAEVAARLKQGLVITIDYGHTAQDLYGPERSHGTLRSYRRHQVAASPLEAVGEQDLTSHVDFTSLAQAGARAGLDGTAFTNQLSFLISVGIESYCAALPADSPELLAIAHLMRPHGMGTTFKLLFQQKGLPHTEWLGLKHKPFFDSILDRPERRPAQDARHAKD